MVSGFWARDHRFMGFLEEGSRQAVASVRVLANFLRDGGSSSRWLMRNPHPTAVQLRFRWI